MSMHAEKYVPIGAHVTERLRREARYHLQYAARLPETTRPALCDALRPLGRGIGNHRLDAGQVIPLARQFADTLPKDSLGYMHLCLGLHALVALRDLEGAMRAGTVPVPW